MTQSEFGINIECAQVSSSDFDMKDRQDRAINRYGKLKFHDQDTCVSISLSVDTVWRSTKWEVLVKTASSGEITDYSRHFRVPFFRSSSSEFSKRPRRQGSE
jgi:hypothetical protein